MTIKIRDPRRWKRMPDDMALTLEGQGRRPVTLEVHTMGRVKFEAVYPDETVAFLGIVEDAIEKIEFVAQGPVEVWALPAVDGDVIDVFFYTDEGRNLAFVNDGKVSFTVPHMRGSENERLIEMQALMLANSQRNEARMAGYLEKFREREAARRAAEAQDDGGDGEGELSEGEGQQDPPAALDGGTEGVAGEGAK